jgi:tetratricopeptide (TPR) repeat protein
MTPVKTMTLARFVLHFTGVTEPELWKTEFHHPHYAPGGRRAARGKDEGAHQADGSFQWSAAVKVLAAYLLRCAAFGRRDLDEGAAGGGCPSLQGGKATPAATLNYALSKKNEWIGDMFGSDSEGRPFLLDLIRRSNADLKRKGEPIVLRLDPAALPPQRIDVVLDDRCLHDAVEIERLAETIERSLKPPQQESCAAVALRIHGSLADWPQRQREVEATLAAAGIKNFTIIIVQEGSILLTLKLPPEEAERLFWAVYSGALDDLGALGVEYVSLAEAYLLSFARTAVELSRQGKGDEALRQVRQASEVLRQLQPLPERAEVAVALHNLAAIYLAQGLHARAEEYLLAALAVGRHVWRTNHPNLARCLHNLAVLNDRLGKQADAERDYRRALDILGPEGAEAAAIRSNLGSLCAMQGRLQEAEELLRQSIETRRRAFGDSHPDLAVTRRKLAAVFARQGRLSCREQRSAVSSQRPQA